MRLFIIGAVCAISITGATIGTAYRAPAADHTPRTQPTASVAAPTLVPTTPQPGTWCGNIDPGLWKRVPPAAAPPIDGTALPTPQTLSDTMTLPPPGGTVPMPNACLPQQTPPPSSTPGMYNVVEPLSP